MSRATFPRAEGNDDLVAVGLWALLVVGVISLPVVRDSFVRVLVAGPFLLFVPGYVLLAVLFPRSGQLSPPERGTYSVGASLALVALLGIPLDGTPWGITLRALLAEQMAVLVVLAVAAAVRRSRIEESERADPAHEVRTELSRAFGSLDAVGGGSRALRAAIAVAVVASVGATAYTAATPLPSERYTELSVLGPDGTVEGIPSNVSTGESVPLLVQVANNEHRQRTYGIQVQLETAEGTEIVERTETTLAHGEEWSKDVAVSVPSEGSWATVRVLLFEDSAPDEVAGAGTAYRSVRVSLDITS
jgi:uncharacterized membrane protein